MEKSTTLKEFIDESIEEMGIDILRMHFGVTDRTIENWRDGHCLPRADQMKLLVKLSEGRVSYEEMIETFTKSGKRANNRQDSQKTKKRLKFLKQLQNRLASNS